MELIVKFLPLFGVLTFVSVKSAWVTLYFKGVSEAGSSGKVAVSFIIWAICSALARFIGVKVATNQSKC